MEGSFSGKALDMQKDHVVRMETPLSVTNLYGTNFPTTAVADSSNPGRGNPITIMNEINSHLGKLSGANNPAFLVNEAKYIEETVLGMKLPGPDGGNTKHLVGEQHSKSDFPGDMETDRRGEQWARRLQAAMVGGSCSLCSLVALGMAFSLGSVYIDIMDTFDTSRPLAAMVQSLCLGIGFGAGIVTGPVVGRCGGPVTVAAGSVLCCVGCIGSSLAPNISVLIVCYGGITGAGVSCLYLAAQVVVGTMFHAKSHVTIPVVTMAGGVGMTAFPPLVRWLTDEYGLRGMFLIMAGVGLQCALFAAVIKTFGTTLQPPEVSITYDLDDGEKGAVEGGKSGGGDGATTVGKSRSEKSLQFEDNISQDDTSSTGTGKGWSCSQTFQTELFTNRRYMMITVLCYQALLTLQSPSIFLTDIVRDRGLTVGQGTQLLMVMYACNVLGRGGVALVKTLCKLSMVPVFGAVLLSCGLSTFTFTLVDYANDDSAFVAYVIACALSGTCLGMLVTSAPMTCLEVVGIRQYAQGLGYLFFMGGFCTSVGGPLGGWLKDHTGSYNIVFYTALAQGIFAFFVVLFIVCCSGRCPGRHSSNTTTKDSAAAKQIDGQDNKAFSADSDEPSTRF